MATFLQGFHSVLCVRVFIRVFVFARTRSFAAYIPVIRLFHARYSAYARTNMRCPGDVLFRARKYARGIVIAA